MKQKFKFEYHLRMHIQLVTHVLKQNTYIIIVFSSLIESTVHNSQNPVSIRTHNPQMHKRGAGGGAGGGGGGVM
jgi:hypothetical protein